jgi:cyclase
MSVANVPLPELETYPRTELVASGVYAITQADGSWGLSNAGLVVGDDVVILIDTYFTERRNTVLRGLVTKLAPMPPTLLVNTHHHGDHVYGNGWFPEAVVVTHEDTRERVLKLDSTVSARRFSEVVFGVTRPTPASVTFREQLRLHVDDMTLDVLCPSVAHCPGNTVVFVRERSVLFAGDLLLKDCTPSFSGGSAHGFLAVLEQLRELGAERIVPGHGPVCDGSVIDETERYVRFVIDLAGQALSAGLSPLDAAQEADLGQFAPWLDPERLVGNLYQACSELAPEGTPWPMSTAAMWRDTEAYLGRPLRSFA